MKSKTLSLFSILILLFCLDKAKSIFWNETMNFSRTLQKVITTNAKITTLLTTEPDPDVNEFGLLQRRIQHIQRAFNDPTFCRNLNDHILNGDSKIRAEMQEFLNALLENLIIYVNEVAADSTDTVNLSAAVGLFEKIAALDIKQFVCISSGLIAEILKYARNEHEFFTRNVHLILSVVAQLSEHKFYDKLSFSPEYPLDEILAELTSLSNENTKNEVDTIKANLNAVSMETRLANFQRAYVESGENVEVLIHQANFFADLRFVSTIMNNSVSFAYWHLFRRYDSYAILTKLLEFFFDALVDSFEFDAEIR